MRAAFVHRIDVAVQKADGDARDLKLLDRFHEGRDGRFVERQDDFAGGVQTLCDDKAPPPGHQGQRLFHVDVILLEAAFGSHFDAVAKTFRGHQRRDHALAFDQGIGR